MNIPDIIEEIRESFNYYTIDDVNLIYEFIKRNETHANRLVYHRDRNVLTAEKPA
jgi:hypothetical protein